MTQALPAPARPAAPEPIAPRPHAGEIHVAAAIVNDGGGRTLVARSRGTTPFMQPGGKYEPGETPREAMTRELREELGVAIDPDAARYVGRFTAPAANHPGRTVVAEIFAVEVDPALVAATAEVEQVEWIDPDAPGAIELAPLTELLLPHARPVGAPTITVRRTREDDWREVRALRLEMLEDEPVAYLETLANAERSTEADWRIRAARGSADASISLAAIDADGAWLGTMGGFVPESGRHTLVAVYVTPRARGREHGVTDALLAGIEAWARARGDELLLEVHETNVRARRAYETRGFVLTGARSPYPLQQGTWQLQMRKAL